jgi:hypothetical protein
MESLFDQFGHPVNHVARLSGAFFLKAEQLERMFAKEGAEIARNCKTKRECKSGKKIRECFRIDAAGFVGA